MILFGHHPIRSLTATSPTSSRRRARSTTCTATTSTRAATTTRATRTPIHLGADLQALLLAHPDVIAYVAGHTHEHKITPFARPGGGGFWGIETSSEIDWPIQSRLIEVMDNRDGTLSIFGTLIDHARRDRDAAERHARRRAERLDAGLDRS